MTHTKLKIATLIAAGLAFGSASALALDGKVVLDQLVKKGVLTAEEADAIIQKDVEKKKADPAPTEIEAKQKDLAEVKIGGRVQVQGKFFTRDDHNGTSDSGQTPSAGFELRRFNIETEAKFKNGFSMFGALEMVAGNTGGGNSYAQGGVYIDKAGVAYNSGDYGIFTAAIQKAKYGIEEYTSASDIYTIERSAISNYFSGSGAGTTNIGLGGRHIGLYWDSKDNKAVEKEGGLIFGAGLANAYQGAYNTITTPAAETYAPVFYGNVGYVAIFSETSKLRCDLNLAYTEANINQVGGLGGTTNTNANWDSRTTGIEFVSKYTLGKLTVLGDVMTAFIENGRNQKNNNALANNAMPFGLTGTLAYRVTDELEPLVQLGYVDSDGRGITDGTFRDAPLNGNTASPAAGVGGATYDRAYTMFIGSAWYITPKSLKLTAGLDCARFEGRANTSASAAKQQSDIIGGRVQIQALF